MPPRPGLTDHWLAETIRLREAHWGPIQDASELRQARAGAGGLNRRILLRARLLAQRDGLADTVERLRRAAAVALCLAVTLAISAGAGAALAALGDGARPVNIVWALGALLGVHALAFLAWLASLGWHGAGAGLGQAWLWAAQRLARGPDAALALQALTGLLARHGALRWLLGAVTHGLWLVALAASLAALLLALSTRRYGFAWETTILDPQRFVELTAALGWLPARLGLAMPDAATVLASDGTQPLAPGARALWANWLVGVLACYGIAPRLVAWALCSARAVRALRRLRIDPDLPGHAALRDRLAPTSERMDHDAAEPAPILPKLDHAVAGPVSGAVLVGVELAPDLPWPPPGLPPQVRCEPVLDGREQRAALLERLSREPPARLGIACDARQTPDRGTLALIVELAAHAGATRVWLAHGDASPRAPGWRRRLAQAGLAASAAGHDLRALLAWLEDGHE